MTNTEVKELTTKIDAVYQTVIRLEERITKIDGREVGKINTDHAHIVRVQGVCGGRPIIEGTRISVKLIVGWARTGMTPKEIAAQYPHIPISQIVDALAYYKNHPEEIEAEFAEEKRYLETEIPRIQAMIAKENSKGSYA
ncbi:MAG: DUF433 domain-containing protein [Chloroflexota bacterium]|nr:DUF433 domain-containing protein [Chloroflexota bacterium]